MSLHDSASAKSNITMDATMRTAALVTVVITGAMPAAALGDPVTISFEALDQSGVYAGDTWTGGDTIIIDDQFRALGIDFNGGGSGFHHTNVMLTGGDGDISLMNAFRSGGGDTRVSALEMTAVGSLWSSFSLEALTTEPVTMTAYDSGGAVLESIVMSTGTYWRSFAFTASGIARVRVFGDGGDALMDGITFEPTVVPLPVAGVAGLAGLALVAGVRRRLLCRAVLEGRSC